MVNSVSGKMNQIARCDWLPERARWGYLVRSGLPAVSREKNVPLSQIINPLLIKLFRSRWLDIGSFLSCEFIDLDSVSVFKHAKEELNLYPAILTSHLVLHVKIHVNQLMEVGHVVNISCQKKSDRKLNGRSMNNLS